jgi:hypothetical protein
MWGPTFNLQVSGEKGHALPISTIALLDMLGDLRDFYVEVEMNVHILSSSMDIAWVDVSALLNASIAMPCTPKTETSVRKPGLPFKFLQLSSS